MKRPSVKTALVCSFSLMAVMTAGLAAYSVFGLGNSNNQVEALAQDWLPSVKLIKETDVAISDLRVAFRDHILAVDDQTEAAAADSIAREHKRLITTLDEYESS